MKTDSQGNVFYMLLSNEKPHYFCFGIILLIILSLLTVSELQLIQKLINIVKTSRGISGMLASFLLSAVNIFIREDEFFIWQQHLLFLLHSQYCKRTDHLSVYWHKTVLYTENYTTAITSYRTLIFR